MEADMNEKKITVSQAELAHLGEGVVGYLREIESDELMGRFPGMPQIAPGLKLWALFAADGRPILLADARDRALMGALENNIAPVSLH
jgi:hypothetical protein